MNYVDPLTNIFESVKFNYLISYYTIYLLFVSLLTCYVLMFLIN